MNNTVTNTAELSNKTPLSTMRIGIQGFSGAFHEIAARQFFGNQTIDIVPAHTFSELVDGIEKGEQMDAGLMAIENTLAGSLMDNYRLLLESQLKVSGEVFLRIQQNLLTLPGVRIEDLKEVHSHPVAIAQCRAFFSQYPHIQLVETFDTALSARDVKENNWKHIGAIASSLAANLYDLEICAPAIETNKHNHTRFLVLEKQDAIQTTAKTNKVSLSFTVDHEVGSLYKILAVLAAYNVNLTKIQSAPIIGKPWEYLFFVDFVMQDLPWEQAIEAIRPITKELHVLGAYPEGVKQLS